MSKFGLPMSTSKMSGNRASIIIVTYNGASYLEQYFSAVLQDMGLHDEVIVVDNASTDQSGDLIRRRWPNVRLMLNEANLGFAVACNQGASRATGQYLVFLNQDTQVLPGWLDGLLDALGDRSVGLSTSKLLLMSQPDRIQTCGRDLHYAGLNCGHGTLGAVADFSRPEAVGAVDGASFAVRREVWTKLGGFAPEFFMYFEDTDLSWRVQLAGYACVYVPTSVAYHDVSLRPSAAALYYISRNRYILLLKHWRWPTLLLLGPGILLAEIASWGESIQQGWPAIRARWRAYWWLLTNLREVLEMRQNNQSQRQVPDWVILGNRSWTLASFFLTGGVVGQVLTRLANVLLFANAWLAVRICRLMKW